MLVGLASTPTPEVVVVGGKGRGLIELTRNGFNVPPGTILTTAFFAPWIAAVQASAAWRDLASSYEASLDDPGGRERVAELAGAVKAQATSLALTGEQRDALAAVREEFAEGALAVRSSSPEEDLAGASFAGLYETVLDVGAGDLEGAVRRCFLSCLDGRVFTYKLNMGFTDPAPSIAVVVQRMVPSETSGVAFSLNPLTNDFDEMLVNAHRGLGEALVAGEITPDAFVVDKVSGAVIDERPSSPAEGACLDRAELGELLTAVAGIESHYGRPMDVEWAFADGPDGARLHILQARPITAYVPLAAELQTAPGEQRCLYIDRALTDGLTMSGPISPLTNDYVERAVALMLKYLVDIPEDADLVAGGFCLKGSRIYFNISPYMHLMGNREALARQLSQMNMLLADMLASVDMDRYRPAEPPDFLRWSSLLRMTPMLLWRLRAVLGALMKPMFGYERFRRTYSNAQDEYDRWLATPVDHDQPLDDFLFELFAELGRVTLVATAPSVAVFYYGGTDVVNKLIDLNDPVEVALADAIRRGYPGDLVVQMGIAMFDLARQLPPELAEDLDELVTRLEQRGLPEAFLAAWDAFIARFGCRGPLEMEFANPKYGDDPRVALAQIAPMAASRDSFDPRAVQKRLVAERQAAFAELRARLPRRKRRRLDRAYRTIENHYHAREMIKHHVTQANARLRERVVRIADQLVDAGRLDSRDDVFELTFADLQSAVDDADFDVRSRVATGGAFYRELKRQGRHFPHAIDSRGRIPRPERREDDASTLHGAAMSPGTARGPAKVLNDPFEQSVEPGDVLVAVTTDPGWTPLFVNAAAVVLEIGGELQHGALVAREFGKPCVAGIADVMSRIEDGQTVEVDGAAGTVRIIVR